MVTVKAARSRGSSKRRWQPQGGGSGGNEEEDKVEEAVTNAMASGPWQGRRGGGCGGKKEKVTRQNRPFWCPETLINIGKNDIR